MSIAPQVGSKTPDEIRAVSVSFASRLDDELLIGTPSLSVSPSGLSLGTAIVSTEMLSINGQSMSAGEAVQFIASAGDTGTTYQVTMTCQTATQTLQGTIILIVT